VSKKIYVGNLSYNTGEENLADLFAQYGTVNSAKIIFDRETNRSKGFGFIEMEEAEAAEAAISELNNSEFDGRNLRVNEAVERERRPRNNDYRY
jgi:RNA recognition motif-containing protein